MPLSAEALELREAAREFSAGALRPETLEWDARREIPGEVLDQLAELGFWGLRIPEEAGGLGLNLEGFAAVLEGLAWGDASVAMAVAIHNGPAAEILWRYGTPEQRAHWLEPAATGDLLLGFALAEAEAGAELPELQTRAHRDGAGWRLHGEKAWVTHGDRAGALVVLAGTREGPSAFIVPTDAEGVEILERETTLGFSATSVVGVRFDGAQLPAEALLGREGAGGEYVDQVSAVGRLAVSAQAVGIAQAALDHAREYAGEREQFGRPLTAFGAIREKLAEMLARVASSRATVAYAAQVGDRGEPGPDGLGFAELSSLAKVVASRSATWVADEAVQIFGGYGYMRHYPVEKLLRDAQGTEIYEGTNEALLGRTASALLQ